MKRALIAMGMALCFFGQVQAQNDDFGDDFKEDFESFRRAIHKDFNNFRRIRGKSLQRRNLSSFPKKTMCLR